MPKKYKIVNDDLCICGHKDFIEHAFVECPLLVEFWNEVDNTIHHAINKRNKISSATKIFGISNTELINYGITTKEAIIINNILILAKFCINKTRAQDGLNFKVTFEFVNGMHVRTSFCKIMLDISN